MGARGNAHRHKGGVWEVRLLERRTSRRWEARREEKSLHQRGGQINPSQ